jgi:hypothetical protein
VEVRIRIEDEIEKAFSRPCLCTSEEKLDTGQCTRVVSGICVVVHETDTSYASQKPLYVGLVLGVCMRKFGTSVGCWYKRRYKYERYLKEQS